MSEKIMDPQTNSTPAAKPVARKAITAQTSPPQAVVTEEKGVSASHPARASLKTIVGLILIGLLAGMAGGVYGALNLAERPGIQKLFTNRASTAPVVNQNLVLNEESAVTTVVETASPAVVSIVVSKELNRIPSFGFLLPDVPQGLQQVGAGTGFFVSSDGLILTNRHVVNDTSASYAVVTNDGKSYDAKVVSLDPVNDLAIVKVDIKSDEFLSFADSKEIKLGQHVVAIGNSLGQYQNTVTSGIVSGIGRSIVAGDSTGSEQLEGVIQTDAAINPGNSGGPLLNLAGQVIGINTAVDQQGQSVGFAIPSNDAKVALDSYRETGKITRPFIGVRYMMLTEASAKELQLERTSGALLLRGNNPLDVAVLPGSPADRAGLKENDIIIRIESKEINEDNTLSNMLRSYRPGQSVRMDVLSGGSEKTVTVTLGETP